MNNFLRSSSFSQETASLFTNEKYASACGKVVKLLNESLMANASQKCEIISKVQELILHSDTDLLLEFLDNILSFAHDTNQDVRKSVAGFIEEVCKINIPLLPKLVNVLFALLRDSAPSVAKRVIQGSGAIYKQALQWICSLTDITEEVEQAWNTLCLIKASILDMIDNDNDGIRTNAIKFLEGVVILQTYPDEDSMKRENDFSLENVPLTLKIARRRKLEDEAVNIFELLLQFHAASHISSVNLIACTGTLCIIAKMRPSMMNQVVDAFKNLHANLPPTLTNSQVSSVRKNLKMQFMSLLKHPACYEHQTSITQILQDLGASNTEIGRAIPKLDKREQQRRAKRALENSMSSQLAAKKAKLGEHMRREKERVAAASAAPRQMEVDFDELNEQRLRSNRLNEQFLTNHLQKIGVVVQLVMNNMAELPSEPTQHFLQTYSPTSPDVTIQQQIQKIAQTFAEQMTDNKVGPGVSAMTKEVPMRPKISDDEERSIIHGPKRRRDLDADTIEDEEEEEEIDMDKLSEEDRKKLEAKRKLRETLERAKGNSGEPRLKQRVKALRLQDVTKPLPRDFRHTCLNDAVRRILKAEKQALIGGAGFKRKRIVTVFGSCFMFSVRDIILEFVLEDISKRLDLAFSWIFEEYNLLQGFTRHTYIKSEMKPDFAYTQLLLKIVTNVVERQEFREKESILKRVYLEAPMIPDDLISMLSFMCQLEELSDCGMQITKDLLIRRPPKEKVFLNILFKYAFCENVVIREKAIHYLMHIYSLHHILMEEMESRALLWLGYLEEKDPPEGIFAAEFNRAEQPWVWNDELAKTCLGLFLELLVYKQELMHRLSEVYIKATSDMKRAMLRAIEAPVRKIGADSEELLKLIEQCPKGSETIITRIIYILTEKTIPRPELVERVRNLHQTKVSDVRLLIPVINGLTKKEILNALPNLIKLNPVVVKEVFNRLLGIGAEYSSSNLPITAAELLVALHTIDTNKVELKWVVKATSLCLAEKETYTHDVLGNVIQQLVEVTPLPTLLMRTVIQSLTLHPRLAGFVMNLLQRLIGKQVWKQKVVWDGFLKCAQRLTPQSLGILIQLPAVQLQDALNICPKFRAPMLEHAREIMEHQIGHVSQDRMDVLLGISPHTPSGTTDVQVVGTYSDNVQMTPHLPVMIKQEKDAERPEPAPPGMD
ncbi:symplekin [Toxorhynchites rutilus septentrionalis]|uniref:symplekin n=1 Tax=Toxorhynchites rutilus septentrionalis TaxID=329112 RepID=UPI00247A994F|nr:symplekin [Toxorhynchites rutilus septentrionalis]